MTYFTTIIYRYLAKAERIRQEREAIAAHHMRWAHQQALEEWNRDQVQ